jgi:hypothetical protein
MWSHSNPRDEHSNRRGAAGGRQFLAVKWQPMRKPSTAILAASRNVVLEQDQTCQHLLVPFAIVRQRYYAPTADNACRRRSSIIPNKLLNQQQYNQKKRRSTMTHLSYWARKDRLISYFRFRLNLMMAALHQNWPHLKTKLPVNYGLEKAAKCLIILLNNNKKCLMFLPRVC